MLRHIFFSVFLLFINITYSFEYLSNVEPSLGNLSKKSKSINRFSLNRDKNFRKRQDYEMVYDSEPVAQIDVASFIQTPDDTLEGNQPYEEERDRKPSYYRDSLMDNNNEINNDVSRDYRSLDVNDIPEVNILYSKTKHIVPQNIDLNAFSVTDNNGILDTYKLNAVKKINNDLTFDIGHNAEKKCVLKNMRIPFFSRNKDTKTKERKKKKRRLFGFGKTKKQTPTATKSDIYLNTDEVYKTITEVPHMYNKVIKRSYFKNLCPACREKVMMKGETNSFNSRKTPDNGIIHNSRQYYKLHKSNPNEPNLNLKNKNLDHNLDEDSFNDRRWKRQSGLSVQEKNKQELEEIQKRVDNVKVKNNQEN